MKENKIKLSSGFIKYFYNTGWLMLDKVLQICLAIFISAWVVRYLGSEDFGMLSYALSFVGLFSVFANLGIDEFIVRDIVLNPDNRDKILGTSLVLKFGGAFLSIILILLALQFTSTTFFERKIILIAATAQFFSSFGILNSFFQSQVKAKLSSSAGIILLVFSSTFKIILITSSLPLIYFAYLIFIEKVLQAGILIFLYNQRKLNIFDWKFSLSISCYLLKNSWPLILSGIFISLNMKIDQTIIKELLDYKSVGVYAAAVRLSEAWYFIPSAIAASFFPAIINSKNVNENIYLNRLARLFSLVLWLSFIASLLIWFLAFDIIDFLYGNGFEKSAGILKIHVFGGIAVSFGIVWSKFMLIENMQKYIIIFHVISAFLNIMLNFLLIPKIGVIGAAYATFASYLGSQIIGILTFKRKIIFKLLKKAINPLTMIKE